MLHMTGFIKDHIESGTNFGFDTLLPIRNQRFTLFQSCFSTTADNLRVK